MTKLADRKRPTITFETSMEIRTPGSFRTVKNEDGSKTKVRIPSRAIVITASPYLVTVRLKQSKQHFQLDWESVWALAAKKEANRVRAEKLAARKSRSK